MMYNVYQHWDPLKVCVVGRSYPPEFYSWINKPSVRSLFERIAQETEEDFQNIIKTLESFGVTVLRPDLPKTTFLNGQYVSPPMTPRDTSLMVGTIYYESNSFNFNKFYNNVKDSNWPTCATLEEFYNLPKDLIKECHSQHNLTAVLDAHSQYNQITQHVRNQGNIVKSHLSDRYNGAMVSRIGQDLYFGTHFYRQDNQDFVEQVNLEFFNTRNHVVNTGGHADATFCAVCPGLIISLFDVPSYAKTFPGWEVVYLPEQSWHLVDEFVKLKEKNKGRWWIPGFEHDQDVVNTVETWLSHWTGYVEETVFDVNMLVIDPKNVMVFNYNKQVFDTLDRYGITPHIVPFRHRYFWDGGIHCVTSDLHREGHRQNYFPER